VLCRLCYKNKMTASPTAAETASASAPETAASDLAVANSSAPAAVAAEARRQPPQPEFPATDVSIAI
jgi:hypothetical protein